MAPQDVKALWVSVDDDGKQHIDPQGPFETIEEVTDYVVGEILEMAIVARESLPLELEGMQ